MVAFVGLTGRRFLGWDESDTCWARDERRHDGAADPAAFAALSCDRVHYAASAERNRSEQVAKRLFRLRSGLFKQAHGNWRRSTMIAAISWTERVRSNSQSTISSSTIRDARSGVIASAVRLTAWLLGWDIVALVFDIGR